MCALLLACVTRAYPRDRVAAQVIGMYPRRSGAAIVAPRA